MDIQSIAIDRIIPYWNNARNNSKAVKPVEESIKKYGFNQPLVLDKNFEIIVGHTRYFALLNLGYKEAPCIIVDLDEERRVSIVSQIIRHQNLRHGMKRN